jgi:hypothetical protein
VGFEVTGRADVELAVCPRGDGLIELVFVQRGVRHVAVFTPEELDRVKDVLDDLPEQGGPVDLSAAYRAVIGRDPFDSATAPAPDETPWWRDLVLGALLVASGLAFGAQESPLWVRLLGWVAAAFGLVIAVGGGWRRLRRRRTPPAAS